MEMIKSQTMLSKKRNISKRNNDTALDMENLSWDIIESYFDGRHLTQCVRHQLESYNHFVNNEIQKTIDMFNPVTIHSEHDYDKDSNKYALEMIITFSNFHTYRPEIHENNGATKLCFLMKQG